MEKEVELGEDAQRRDGGRREGSMKVQCLRCESWTVDERERAVTGTETGSGTGDCGLERRAAAKRQATSNNGGGVSGVRRRGEWACGLGRRAPFKSVQFQSTAVILLFPKESFVDIKVAR